MKGDARSTTANDTSAAARRRQIDLWRAMTPMQKAKAVTDINAAVRSVALAGVRHRHPEATERECFLRLAEITLGPELARQAYPELASLVD